MFTGRDALSSVEQTISRVRTDESRLDILFLSTLSRYPEPEERKLVLEAVAAAKTDEEKQRALGDVLWALLNSAEFTFNH